MKYEQFEGNEPVPGLEDGRQYEIIKYSDTEVQLGEQLESSLSSVNLVTDALNFGHSVSFNGPYSLGDWDPTTWDSIVYHSVEEMPIEGLQDGNTYLVNKISDSEVMLVDTSLPLPVPPQPISGDNIDASDSTRFSVTSHGFKPGQHVTYRAADPAVFSSSSVNVSGSTSNDGVCDSDVALQPDDSNSILLGDEGKARIFDDTPAGSVLVEYHSTANPLDWYWTEGPENQQSSTADPNASKTDRNRLTGTSFWTANESGSGVASGYTNWADSEPLSNEKHNLKIDSNGEWHSVSGTDPLEHYILERTQFVLFPDESQVNHSDAKSFAEKQGGWLPSITSEDEWQLAKEAAQGKSVWLGGSDADKEDRWVWDGGSHDPHHGEQFWQGGADGYNPSGGFSNWSSGEPNDSGPPTAVENREVYMEMYENGYWNDTEKHTKEKHQHTQNYVLVEFPKYKLKSFVGGTFAEAKEHARSEAEGWVATIGSQADNDAVQTLLEDAELSGKSAWIGGASNQVIGGLKNSSRYYAKSFSDSTHCSSVQLFEEDSGTVPIPLDNTGLAASINHTLIPVANLPLGGLQSGQTYYVSADATATEFSLQESNPFVIDQVQVLEGDKRSADTQQFQSFQPTEDNLTGASVKVSSQYIGSVNPGSGDVTLSLYDTLPQTGVNPMATAMVSGVLPGQWAEVSFEPEISVTADSIYYLKFSSSNPDFQFAGTKLDSYPQGTWYLNETPSSGDVAFKTFSQSAFYDASAISVTRTDTDAEGSSGIVGQHSHLGTMGVDLTVGSDLLRDGVYVQNGTYNLQVPDGTYDIELTLGDTSGPLSGHQDMQVFLEGELVDTVTTQQGTTVTNHYPVDVSDGELTLRLFVDTSTAGTIDAYAPVLALNVTSNAQGFEPQSIDFGTPGSPLAAGYTRGSSQSFVGNSGYVGSFDRSGVGKGLHNFRFDLGLSSHDADSDLSGKQKLTHVKLGQRATPDGSGTASSSVRATGGTLIAQTVRPTASSEASPLVTVELASGSLLHASENIDIDAISAGNVNSKTEGFGGALLASVARANATSSSSHAATILLSGSLHANRQIIVESKISDTAKSSARTEAFGAIDANAFANATIQDQFDSTITVDNGARLLANDAIELKAYTAINSLLASNTESGALFGSSHANMDDNTGIVIKPTNDDWANSTAVYLANAELIADRVSITSELRELDTRPEKTDSNDAMVYAHGGGMQNTNQAKGLIEVMESVLLTLDDGLRIISDEVHLLANHKGIDLFNQAYTHRGKINSHPETTTSFDSQATITSSSDVELITNVLTVTASYDDDGTGLQDSNFQSIAKSEKEQGESYDQATDLTVDRQVTWDGVVRGHESARLEVDSEGKVSQALGVTIINQHDTQRNEGDSFSAGDQIFVQDVTYSQVNQTIDFSSGTEPSFEFSDIKEKADCPDENGDDTACLVLDVPRMAAPNEVLVRPPLARIDLNNYSSHDLILATDVDLDYHQPSSAVPQIHFNQDFYTNTKVLDDVAFSGLFRATNHWSDLDRVDITSPGDVIGMTETPSTPSVTAEQVPSAIDNDVNTKYLNFDKENTGFIVTPSGSGVVTGLALTSANDSPARDPASFRLAGSHDGVDYTLIDIGEVPPFTERHQRQELLVHNPEKQSYLHYRLTFPTLADTAHANSMQIGEVELLAGRPKLELQGSVVNAKGFSELLNFSGDIIVRPSPTEGDFDIDTNSLFLHAPDGSIHSTEATDFRVRLQRSTLEEVPQLNAYARHDLTLDLQIEPDEKQRAYGIERLEGENIDLGLMAWPSGSEVRYIVSGFATQLEVENTHHEIRAHGDLTISGLTSDATAAATDSNHLVSIEAHIDMSDLEQGELNVSTNGDIELYEGVEYVPEVVAGQFSFHEIFAHSATHARDVAVILDAPAQEWFEQSAFADDAMLDAGPAGYWRLNETTGTLAKDFSGNNINGSFSGVTQGMPGVYSSHGVSFPTNSDSYVEIPDSSELTSATAQTVTGWFKVDDLSVLQSIYYNGDQNNNDTALQNRENTLWVYPDGSMHLAAAPENAGTQTTVTTPAGLVQEGRWHHFATVLDATAGSMAIYLDGNLVVTGIYGPTLWSGGDIGSSTSSFTVPWVQGEPNNAGVPENSAEISSDGTWNDRDSAAPLQYYVLERPEYYLYSTSGLWKDAKAQAHNESAYLASITSDAEQTAAQTAANGQEVWLAGSDKDDNEEWYWKDGPKSGVKFWSGDEGGSTRNSLYANWNDGEPNNDRCCGNTEDKTLMLADGYWDDRGGSKSAKNDESHYALFQRINVFSLVTAPPGGSFTYEEAQMDAQNQGGWLAIIGDSDDQQDVKSILPASGTAWIGASDNQQEGSWQWNNPLKRTEAGYSDPTWSYTNWTSGEPNNGRFGTLDAHYAVLRMDGKWQDQPETATYPYVLENPVGSYQLVPGSFTFTAALQDA
ncbi:MAG: hypothetical protein GY826_12670 [Fuerstiella sp.]|nr:hypothetical protein [Fuerstiella sp.]